jgi:NMD protein affecting ribosome stability and mRNA decay
MTTMKRVYNTNYKKKNDQEYRYGFRRSPKGVLSCRACGAVYFHGRWSLQPAEAIRRRVTAGEGVKATYCPACMKIREGYWQGIVEISGIENRDKPEIIRLIRNEETSARGKNPLERVIAIVTDKSDMRVETTTEKLAQRLGRALKKARGGKVTYKWSERNKFARVVWEKAAGGEAKAGRRLRVAVS